MPPSSPAIPGSAAGRYGIRLACSYEHYQKCLESGEVDAVYIALPNHLHRDYAVRAAKAGIHVLCEKPMAITEADCRAMIAAAENAKVNLMVAYRLHFEPANLEAVRLALSGELGEARNFDSVIAQQVKKGDVRLSYPQEQGGGMLHDIGIYPINAARYLFRDEPIEVAALQANNGEERFRQTDEMTAAILRFPGERLAVFTSSFGAATHSTYTLGDTKAALSVTNAYNYLGTIRHRLKRNGETRERAFPAHDQFGLPLVHFSDCILNDREPGPSGEEGLADIRIIRALHRSAESGRPISLEPFTRKHRPTPELTMELPPVEQPEPVEASPPPGD
ncbi:MAG: Gfo/Idh/MocA family protein [Bryobacteraceae bacterium]